jgi:hypothetical protein
MADCVGVDVEDATKYCTKCFTTKPVVEFSPRGKGRRGWQSWCKICMSAYSTERARLKVRQRLGLPADTPRMQRLPDGGLTVADVAWAITSVADLIAPGNSPMRLKSHTWVSQLDVHPDHIAVGGAVKALGDSDPTRFGDRRYYVLPGYWGDPDLSLVTDAWDTPANAGIRARAINACRAYGAWAPDRGSYAIGLHSKPDWFATVTATPKCLFHT